MVGVFTPHGSSHKMSQYIVIQILYEDAPP
jgi:hypothetical protein